jgi:hypothetical protein
MPAALLTLITGFISGALTAIVAYYSAYAKARLDLTIEYDKELRKSRLDAYQNLWKRLEPLARYSPPQPITYSVAKKTSADLRDWYFEHGGIYLSREARGPYFDLKDELQRIIDNTNFRDKADEELTGEHLKPMHHAGTALRAALSNDIGTRRQSFLRSG